MINGAIGWESCIQNIDLIDLHWTNIRETEKENSMDIQKLLNTM